MTSGEWDLRALKALEEEEQAQREAIITSNCSETEHSIPIPPPPPAKLPTIEEYCGLIESPSPPRSPLPPLPPPISKPLKLSNICATASVISTSSCPSAVSSPPSSSSPSTQSATLSRDGSLRTHRKGHHTRRSHPFLTLGKKHPSPPASADSITADEVSAIDSAIDRILNSGIIVDSSRRRGPYKATRTTEDMMPMMMFLSPTGPPEVVQQSVGGTTASLLCTGKSDTASDDGENDDDGLCPSSGSFSSRHHHRSASFSKKHSRCNKLLFNSSASSSSTTKANTIDYELQDHIKHCSCSCNHMGYGNSMDYQTTGFGGLPDVTEHSNTRRSITRQDSLAISDSTDVASLQKSSKKHSKPARNQPKALKLCIFSFSIIVTLLLIATVSFLVYYFVLRTPSRNSHDQRLRIVRHILRDIPLVDGHNNLPWNIRKYAQNNVEVLAGKTRELEQLTIWHRPIWSQTDIPRLKEGLVGAQVWSAYVPCEAQGLDAVQLALEQIDIIHRFAELYPTALTLATTTEDIVAAHHRGELASLIGIEGGHALGSSLGVLRSFHSLGARYITLTNQCDISWASSSGGVGATSKSKGLTNFGKAVVKEMNRLGMMIDLSHASDATVRDVLELTRAPVIFSNSAARSICNSSRNVPDDILRAVADNGGLIMIGFDSQHVSCDETSTLADVIAHIKYIRSIAGIEHIGIGARYDGMQSASPVGLEDVSKYPDLLATLLEDSNWSENDISMLAGKNFLRVLSSVENVRDYWKRAAIPPLETMEPIKKSPCTYMTS